VSRFVLTSIEPRTTSLRLTVPVGGDTTGIRASADSSGELYFAVLDRPLRYRGADITQVILRPAVPGQAAHFGMRGFAIELAPVLDPMLRTADPIDPRALDFIAQGQIDDDSSPPPPANDAASDSEEKPKQPPTAETAGDPPRPKTSPPPRPAAEPSRTGPSNRKPLLIAGLAALTLIAAVVLWNALTGTTDSPPQPAAENSTTAQKEPQPPPQPSAVSPAEKPQAVLRLLPPGYPAGACTPEKSVPIGALAALLCGPNTDPGGPRAARYTLFSDMTALQEQFDEVMASAQQQVCPGRIMSPGPWKRNARPEVSAGTLYCGVRDGDAVIAWTDDQKRLLSVIESDAADPPVDQMFSWWQSHS